MEVDDEAHDAPRREIRIADTGAETTPAAAADKPPDKIGADPAIVDKTPYDDVVNARTWSGIGRHDHTGLIGFTKAGKTHYFKQLLADEKIVECEKYIIVADAPAFSEIVTGFAAARYLHTGEWQSLEGKVLFFTVGEIQKAVNLCMGPLADVDKLIFFGDCLISDDNRNFALLANFLNKAKNYKATCVIEIHHFAGPKAVLMKGALESQIFLKIDPAKLAMYLDKQKRDTMIERYASLGNHERVWIHDREEGDFDSHYLPI